MGGLLGLGEHLVLINAYVGEDDCFARYIVFAVVNVLRHTRLHMQGCAAGIYPDVNVYINHH